MVQQIGYSALSSRYVRRIIHGAHAKYESYLPHDCAVERRDLNQEAIARGAKGLFEYLPTFQGRNRQTDRQTGFHA